MALRYAVRVAVAGESKGSGFILVQTSASFYVQVEHLGRRVCHLG
jgi:hypothetical protein